jgi:hypothetical protein
MALFVAQHQHPPGTCPAAAASASGFLLLDHVSAATAARYGVAIQAEAVIDGEHRLILIVEAASRDHVARFMAFLGRFGRVEVFPASYSEAVVARGGCEELGAKEPITAPPSG